MIQPAAFLASVDGAAQTTRTERADQRRRAIARGSPRPNATTKPNPTIVASSIDGDAGCYGILEQRNQTGSAMASEFQMNTLTEIAVLRASVDRILTHLAKRSPDPQAFLATELEQGLESLAKASYWTVSNKNQNEIREKAKTRYSELIGNIRVD